MFNHVHFREDIIRPALNDLIMYSEDAEELIIATLAQETLGGCYVKQVRGPALGIYQLEPASFASLMTNYILPNKDLVANILKGCQCTEMPPAEHLVWNLKFATMMVRIFYRPVRAPLPKKDDINGIWEYYKKYYNSYLGAATKDQFMANYTKFVGLTAKG